MTDKAYKIRAIIISITSVIAIIFCICLYFLKYNTESQVNLFEHINKDGSFVLQDDRVDTSFSDVGTIKKFIWYMDGYCGDCIRVHQKTNEHIHKSILDGSLEIEFHPLNYLSHKSGEYSVVSASFISGVANFENTETTLEFMNKVFTKDTRDSLKDKTKEEMIAFLYKIAVGVGVKHSNTIRDNLETYENAINRASVNIRKFEKWKALSPKEDGSFFVPFIYNAYAEENGKALDGENEDVESSVLGPMMGEINCYTDCE